MPGDNKQGGGGAKKDTKKVAEVKKEVQNVKKEVVKVKKQLDRGMVIRSYPSVSDADLKCGVHDSINSLFYPGLGVHRGQCKTFAMSGLATLKGTIFANNVTAADTYFAFQMQPALANQNVWLQYGFGTTVATAINTPATALVTTTQAESYRVVSAQLTITPNGSLLNQAGSGVTGYIPDNLGFVTTQNNIAQLRISRPFKSIDTQILHWVPSENSSADETEFESILNANGNGSAFLGYMNIPSGNDLTTGFQLDYLIGIEYQPSPTYRPWVDCAPPMVDIRSYKYIGQYAMDNFDPVMVGRVEDYTKYLLGAATREGAWLHQGDHIYDATATGQNQAPHNDKKTLIEHLVQGDSIVGHNTMLSKGGMVNLAIDVLNTAIPGTAYDIPYVNLGFNAMTDT
jgi:hypothetical protein